MTDDEAEDLTQQRAEEQTEQRAALDDARFWHYPDNGTAPQ